MDSIGKIRNCIQATFAILLILSQAGCTKEVIMDLPENEDRITINALFQSNSRISVDLSHSVSLDNYSSNNLILPTIEIYENGLLSDSNISNDSVYVSTVVAKRNHIYKIRVSSDEHETIEAVDTVPGLVSISSVSFDGENIIDESGNELYPIQITFTDEPESNNYYEIKLSANHFDTTYFNGYLNQVAVIEGSPDEIIEEGWFYFSYLRSLIFTDDLIDGKEYTCRLYYYLNIKPPSTYQFNVELNSISRSYYEYKVSLAKYLEKQDIDILLGPPEPYVTYSNVNGGYGIFAAYSSDKRTYYNISNK